LVTIYVLFFLNLGQSPGVDGRLHAATARRMDGTTGQELLQGRSVKR
jgi:hypothetical protein